MPKIPQWHRGLPSSRLVVDCDMSHVVLNEKISVGLGAEEERYRKKEKGGTPTCLLPFDTSSQASLEAEIVSNTEYDIVEVALQEIFCADIKHTSVISCTDRKDSF